VHERCAAFKPSSARSDCDLIERVRPRGPADQMTFGIAFDDRREKFSKIFSGSARAAIGPTDLRAPALFHVRSPTRPVS
jgi:hypothetical protein